MAKLTVYLPDELAEEVRAAGLTVSPVCARALAEAVTGPKVTPTRLGWCRLATQDAELMVRFDLDGPAGLLTLAEFAGAPRQVTGSLRPLPIGPLLDWAEEHREELAREIKERRELGVARREALDSEQRGAASRRVEWGTGEDAVGDIRRREVER